jgi:hypothetical protein
MSSDRIAAMDTNRSTGNEELHTIPARVDSRCLRTSPLNAGVVHRIVEPTKSDMRVSSVPDARKSFDSFGGFLGSAKLAH